MVADAEDVVTTARPRHCDLCDLVTVRLNYVKVGVKVNVDDGVGEFDEIGTLLRLPRVAVEAFLKQLITDNNINNNINFNTAHTPEIRIQCAVQKICIQNKITILVTYKNWIYFCNTNCDSIKNTPQSFETIYNGLVQQSRVSNSRIRWESFQTKPFQFCTLPYTDVLFGSQIFSYNLRKVTVFRFTIMFYIFHWAPWAF